MPYKLTLVLTPKQAADVKYYTEQAARRAGVAEPVSYTHLTLPTNSLV